MPARPQFTKKEQDDIVHKLETMVREDLIDRKGYFRKRARAYEDTFMPQVGTVDYPWEGASNITPPLVIQKLRAVAPRIVGGILNNDPVARVAPIDPTPENQNDAEERELWYEYQLKNQIPNFMREFVNWVHDACHSGTSVLHPYPSVTRRMSPERLIIDNFRVVDETTGSVVAKTDREVIAEVLPSFSKAVPRKGGKWDVTFVSDDMGKEQTARVQIDRDDEDIRDHQLSVSILKMVEERQLKVEMDNAEDWIPTAAARGFQRQDSHHLTHLLRQHPDEIRADKSYFNITSEELEKLEAFVGGVEFQTDQERDAIETELLGVSQNWGLTGEEVKEITVLEIYTPWEIDGEMVDMIFWVIPQMRKLIRWEYHEFLFGHTERPVVDVVFMPIPHRPEGLGIWHLVSPYQDEAATILNQMNDRENLQNNPILLAKQTARLTVGAFRNRAPGDVFTVMDTEAVKPLVWPTNPHGGFPVLQQCFAMADQAGGFGDISSGIQPNRPNAPRTARGTGMLIAESNLIADMHLLLFQEAMKKLLMQLDGLNKQYFPPEIRFQITGKQVTMRRENFRTQVRFFFSANTLTTNPAIQKQDATVLQQIRVTSPFVTGTYRQMAPMAIEAAWKQEDHFIKQYSSRRDSGFLLRPLQDYLQDAEQWAEAQRQAVEERSARDEELIGRDQDRQDVETQTKAFQAVGKIRGQEGDQISRVLLGAMQAASKQSAGRAA